MKGFQVTLIITLLTIYCVYPILAQEELLKLKLQELRRDLLPNNNTENHTRYADLCITPNLSAHNSVDTDPEELATMIEIGYQEACLQLLKPVGFKQWISALFRQCWRKISGADQNNSAEIIIH